LLVVLLFLENSTVIFEEPLQSAFVAYWRKFVQRFIWCFENKAGKQNAHVVG